MDQSDQIIGLLEELSRRLDRIESQIDSVADSSEELESRFAVMSEDLSRDTGRHRPSRARGHLNRRRPAATRVRSGRRFPSCRASQTGRCAAALR